MGFQVAQRTKVKQYPESIANSKQGSQIEFGYNTIDIPEEFPNNLSEMWYALRRRFKETLEYAYYSEKDEVNDTIANLTPEVLLQEMHKNEEGIVKYLIDSINSAIEKITPEITLPRECCRYNPPVLIEACDFISKEGCHLGGIKSALREYTGSSICPENTSRLIQSALPVREALANHTGTKPYGVLFRQYGQDYEKNLFRECKKVSYRIFTAVLHVDKNGVHL